MAAAKGNWRDWLMLIFGVWMIISPFILGYGAVAAAVWNSIIIGIAVVVFALAVMSQRQMWEEWVNLILGVWLIIAPFVLVFANDSPVAAWNHVIFGILIAADAIWCLVDMRRQPHGAA